MPKSAPNIEFDQRAVSLLDSTASHLRPRGRHMSPHVRRPSTRIFLIAAAWFAASAAVQAQAPATATAPGAQTYNYTVTTVMKVAGKQIVNVWPDGRVTTEFSYRDNGRGPDIFEEMVLGSNGQFESFRATGKSTFGAPVAETYSRKNGHASWKSKADAGDLSDVPSAIYIPVESSLEALAVVVRSLLRAPENKLAALPSGQLSLTRMFDAPVSKDKSSAQVTLYQIAGLALEPAYMWMWKTPDPQTARMFGIVNPGFSVVEEGWENNSAALLKLQMEANAATLKNLASKYSRQPAGLTVIRNVRWFDSQAAQVKGPSDVYVHRGLIAAIYPANSPISADATLIDGTDKMLLPGLFDMHGHTSPWDSVLQVAGGVTTLRDMGNENKSLNELKTRIDAGQSIGPHLIPTGYIEGPSKLQPVTKKKLCLIYYVHLQASL